MSIITVPYKCVCMKDEGSFQMQQRDESEDIFAFMERATKALTFAHRKLSPMCNALSVEYIKMPMDDDNGMVGRMKKRTLQ